MLNELLHSPIFAQIMGLYFLIMALIMVLQHDFYKRFIANLKPGSGVIIITAAFSLLIGLIIAIMHNVWVIGPEVIITLIGWFIVIKSILWLVMPNTMVEFARIIYRGPGYYCMVAVIGLLGIFLLIKGFYPKVL